jgi:hypothetical protein
MANNQNRAERQPLLNGNEETSCSARDVAGDACVFFGGTVSVAAIIGGGAALFAAAGNTLKVFPKNDVDVGAHALWGSVAGAVIGFLIALAIVFSKHCCNNNSSNRFSLNNSPV